jgi:hypothetical protein
MASPKCQKCLTEKDFHSFIKFGAVSSSALFYTAPAKARDNNKDGTKLANMKLHIQNDTEGKPWIWVVDCANMKMTHYTEMSFNVQLMTLLSHEPTLQEVWVLRPNAWIKTTTAILKKMSKTNVFNKLKYFEGSNIDIFNKLQTSGLDSNTLRWLIEQ